MKPLLISLGLLVTGCGGAPFTAGDIVEDVTAVDSGLAAPGPDAARDDAEVDSRSPEAASAAPDAGPIGDPQRDSGRQEAGEDASTDAGTTSCSDGSVMCPWGCDAPWQCCPTGTGTVCPGLGCFSGDVCCTDSQLCPVHGETCSAGQPCTCPAELQCCTADDCASRHPMANVLAQYCVQNACIISSCDPGCYLNAQADACICPDAG